MYHLNLREEGKWIENFLENKRRAKLRV